jgi:hypothetical protein
MQTKDQGSDRNVSTRFTGVFNAFAKLAGMLGVSYAALYIVFKLLKIA